MKVKIIATVTLVALFLAPQLSFGVSAYNPVALRAVGYTEAEVTKIISGEVSSQEVDDEKKLKVFGWTEEKIKEWLDNKYRSAVQSLNNYRQGHKESRYDAIIYRAAKSYGVKPSLIKAVISVESGFAPCRASHKGAVGLMQLMPYTAMEMGVRDSCDPEENIHGGTRYLAEQIKRFGNTRLALAAYNAGPETVKRARGVPRISETQTYVYRVMAKERVYASR